MPAHACTGLTADNTAAPAITFYNDGLVVPQEPYPPLGKNMEEFEKYEMKQKLRAYHRANWEMQELVVSSDSFGRLSVEFKVPHELALQKDLMDGRFMEAHKFVCSESKLTVWHIAWQAHGAYCEIWIDGEDMSPTYLAKAMERAGLPLRISRRKRADVINALYQWILRSAASKEAPVRHGWYTRIDKSYDFADKKTITMKELKEKCQQMR